MPHSFSLATSPWIPVLTSSGEQRSVSLQELFAQSTELRDLALPPTERIAVMRLLLCIAQAALNEDLEEQEVDYPEKEAASWLAPKVAAYLAKWESSFQLFGDGPRFLQFRTSKTEMGPASKLFLTLASGNNPTVFDHGGGSDRAFHPSQLAIGLLTFQNFSPTIGRGYFGQGPAVMGNALHVLRWGNTLSEWILRNLILPKHAQRLCPEHGMGRPIWEHPPNEVGPQANTTDPAYQNATSTVLGRLVPLTRAIWLSEDFKSILLNNGLGFPNYPICQEPTFTGGLFKKKTGEEKHFLVGAELGRALWRDLDAVLCLKIQSSIDKRAPATLLNIAYGHDCPIWIGAAITDQAKVDDVVEAAFIRDLVLPRELLDPQTAAQSAKDYQDAVVAAETWEKHLMKGVYAYGTELKLDPKRRGTLRDTALEAFWEILGSRVAHLFNLVRHPDSTGGTAISSPYGKDEWHRGLSVAAGDAFRSVCLADGPRQMLAWGNALRLLWPPNHDKPVSKKESKPPRSAKSKQPVTA
jgi:CRISPR system Cascade subunit CasA